MAEATMKKQSQYNDMTQGNPLKKILLFAIPLFLGNIFQQVYSMVDTMIAGHALGDQAIASIGATYSLFNMITNFAIGTNNGYGIVVSRWYGAKDSRSVKKTIAAVIVLDVIVATTITVVVSLLLPQILHWMSTPEPIYDRALLYIRITTAGAFATMLYNMCASIMRAFGNSRWALYFLVISCVTNASMDYILIVKCGMDVEGAAIATVIAQALSAVLALGYILKNYREYLPGWKDFLWEKKLVSDLFLSGLAMGLMYTVVDIGSVIFQSANNRLGDLFITAHTAARRFIDMMMSPLSSLVHGFATFVSQNWGAGRVDRVKSTMKKVFVVGAAWSILACVLMYSFGGMLVQMVTGTDNEEVIRAAVMSIRIHLPFYAPLSVFLIMRVFMQAMGFKLVPVVSSGVEMGIKFLFAFLIIPKMGFLGTCITEPIAWVTCMAYVVVMYFLKKDVIFQRKS